MKRKRILYILTSLEVGGGVQSMLMDVYRKIDKNKYDIDFLTYDNDLENAKSYVGEIQRNGGKVFTVTAIKQKGILNYIKEIQGVIRQNGVYDIVHAHNTNHIAIIAIICRLNNIKKIIAHSHIAAGKTNTILRKIYFKFSRMCINNLCTDLFACGNDAARYLYGDNHINAKLIHNSINFKKFYKPTMEEKKNIRLSMDIKPSDFIVTHIGRFTKQKNHRFIVNIIQNIVEKTNNAKVFLVGEGPDKKYIEGIIKDNKLDNRVEFLGVRGDVDSILKATDVLILPSLFEGLPVILIEAQATGINCIVSDNIDKNCDLGLGLIDFMSLNLDSKVWAEKILSKGESSILSANDIKEIITSMGYSIDKTVETICEVYD